ncbi:MAG: ABC-F family ATP-binding cassette domain-containing protein [Desulfobacterales bacterium]|nr:ABC-F family ATP-binding cassette domain-containing protein [Desulfobacterales bacterium]
MENLTKGYGGQNLFEGVNFKLNPRERIGLVGRNGYGKTTLFRLIAQEESPDSGAVTIPKGYRMGYVKQHIVFTEETLLQEAMKGLQENEQDAAWKVEKILAGLGFSQADLHKNPGVFSGGFQVRINLAKVIASEPDLLLLDEPTNYLDITSIRWVERFLINWPRELMLITHNRGLMDKIATHIIGIHRGKLRKIPGTTGKYYAQIAQEEEIYEKTRLNDERRQKELDQFISRFRAKARLANLVQSRVKTLQKMEKNEKLEKIKTLDFSFRSQPFAGKFPLSASDVSFSYDQQAPLIRHLNLSIGTGERVCVVGPNGKGKTTLLKLLAGTLAPQGGKVISSQGVSIGFFEQTHISRLVDSRTVEEEVLNAHADIDRQQARNICGAMLFEGDDALKKINVLSGGEKSRVILGKILARPVNLLILDEPTNHLDMESCDALLAALDNFEGTVVMVTHDEMFLHALAQRLIIFDRESVDVFEGSYQRFLEKRGWRDEDIALKAEPNKAAEKRSQKEPTKKEMRRRRSEIIAERSRVLKPYDGQVDRTENKIAELETQLGDLNAAMIEASTRQDSKRIVELSKSIHHCQSEINRLYDDLEAYHNILSEKNAQFEERLAQLEF